MCRCRLIWCDRETDRQGKRVSSFGRSGKLSLIPLYSLNPSNLPSRTLTKTTTSSRTSHTGPPIPSLPPPSGTKYHRIDRMYKELSDRTLLGPIQATAVHFIGVIANIWYFLCVWKRDNSYILCKLYIIQLQCSSNTVFRQTHKPTVYPAQCSVSVTPATGTWRLLNIFIDVFCPAFQSWLLTAAVLWCWRLTRPALCWICVVIDWYGTTDRQGKHVSSFGRSGKLSSIPPYSPNPPRFPSRPFSNPSTSPRTPPTVPPIPPNGDLGPLPPPSGRNFNLLFCLMHFVQYLC